MERSARHVVSDFAPSGDLQSGLLRSLREQFGRDLERLSHLTKGVISSRLESPETLRQRVNKRRERQGFRRFRRKEGKMNRAVVVAIAFAVLALGVLLNISQHGLATTERVIEIAPPPVPTPPATSPPPSPPRRQRLVARTCV